VTLEIVHVVDDDEEMRSALDRLLRVHDFTVRTYSSAGEFLIAATRAEAGCLILDLQMPGGLSGLELQQRIERDGFALPIIFLSAHGTVPSTVRAMKGGAFDFLTKPVDPDLLVSTVKAALAKAREARTANDRIADARKRFDSLSTREREVFASIVSGHLNKQVGADLGIAERTVKMHRANVMEKMNAASVADLVKTAELLKATGALGEPPVPGT
jgi:FixJ family two-component response regulator